MTQTQIGQDVGVGDEGVGMQKAQRRGLHRPAQVERTAFELLRQVSHNHLAGVAARGPVQHQSERPFGVMLANQHHRPLKERPAQLPAIQQQLAFHECFALRHPIQSLRYACPASNLD
jgi:hypothetical protein